MSQLRPEEKVEKHGRTTDNKREILRELNIVPRKAEELIKILKKNGKGIYYTLNVLVGDGFIIKEGKKYYLSPKGRTFLITGEVKTSFFIEEPFDISTRGVPVLISRINKFNDTYNEVEKIEDIRTRESLKMLMIFLRNEFRIPVGKTSLQIMMNEVKINFCPKCHSQMSYDEKTGKYLCNTCGTSK